MSGFHSNRDVENAEGADTTENGEENPAADSDETGLAEGDAAKQVVNSNADGSVIVFENNAEEESKDAEEPTIQFDDETGYAIDPNSGDLLDPETGRPIDSNISDLE